MNILRIGLNDIRRILKNKQTILWWVAMPLGFILLFGSVMTSPGARNTWLPVVNLDRHELSQIFVDQLRTEGYFVDIRSCTEELSVRNWARAVIIPATFSCDILSGTQAQMIFTQGSGDMQQTFSAQTRIAYTIVKFTGALANINLIDQGWSERTKQDLIEELNQPQQLTIERRGHSSLRPPPSGLELTLPGYLIMFVLMNSIMFGGIMLIEEQQNKQLLRLLAAPISTIELFGGKILGRVLAPALQAFILLLVGNLFFGVSLGENPLALIPVIGAFVLCCGAISLLFGAFCSTPSQVQSLGIMATMILAALGGCWWPIEIIPDSVKTIAMFTPTYWGLQGILEVMYFNKSFNAIAKETIVLLVFASVFISIAIPVFNKMKK